MSINARLAAAEAKATRLRAIADATEGKPLNVAGYVFTHDNGVVTINSDTLSADDAALLFVWFKSAAKAAK